MYAEAYLLAAPHTGGFYRECHESQKLATQNKVNIVQEKNPENPKTIHNPKTNKKSQKKKKIQKDHIHKVVPIFSANAA